MQSPVLIFIMILLTFSEVLAQRFSEDKDEFRTQAITRLKSAGTEAAFKIGFDFQNTWDGKFTSDQQDQIHKIALRMQRKGYQFYPFFYHYFSYLAYSVAQENLQRDELSSLLDINEQVLETLPRKEYADFVFGLNIYFARRYLSLEKTLFVQALDGTYSFKLLDELIEIEDDPYANEEYLEEDTSGFITDEELAALNAQPVDSLADPWATNNDPWGDNNNDPWATNNDPWSDNSNDPWATNNDPWGDNNNDPWATNNDPWGDNSNDPWATSTDDQWGSNDSQAAYEPPPPERPEYAIAIVDHLATVRNKYFPPELSGPVIEISSAEMLIVTPYDSMIVNNIAGTFLLQNRNFVGTQGTVKWPGQNRKFRGAEVQLKDFFLRKDRSDFWTPNASITYDQLFDGSVEGVFTFKSPNRPRRALSRYPTFTSNENNVNVKFSDEKLSYTGGIEIQGNKLFGRSVSKKDGTLTVLDGRGNQVVLKSKFFQLGDSLVSMENGSISIAHGSDSIYHKNVKAKYDLPTKTLTVLRNSSITPFYSSYFNVTMNLDLIKWNMENDSIGMDVMNAKDMVPATFESEDFFDEVRFRKLARFLSFHPISSAVYYAKKYNLTEFYVGELALEYEIDENYAKGAAKILRQYGFADYDSETGLLKLYDKAFHYYDASAKKVDYDNLMVPSKISDAPNAYIELDSGKLNINGVHRFYLTSDFKVYAAPYDSTVTLLRGRNLEFDGVIHAGDFDYQGVGHQFDYEEFLFTMPVIDSMRITIPLRDTTNLEAGFQKTTLANQLTSTSGTLYIDKKENKSGKEKNTNYPFFVSDSEATVYFDGPEILDGAYDKSVRFIIPPFEIDSIEREDGESISFEGTFNSGGIFPTFEEKLHPQEDQSLGFVHKIPDEGYNLYGTDAKTYEEIRLSNQGMRGFGQIDFLTTTIYSDDFIYYPDSVTTDGTSGVISPGTIGNASYPEAILGTYDMYWLPRKDSMYLRTVNEPFKFYNSTAELEGEANITTKGVYGGGTMLTRGSRAISDELSFEEFRYAARHADFEVLTDSVDKPAMAGDDIRLDFDLTNNTATVRPEKQGIAAISFPYAQMKTSITEAVWDLEDSVVIMTKPDDVPIEDSYFYTTREDLDSLAFSAERAVYDINSQKLNVQGIPYITVADSRIIPENNETTILANSVLQKFDNAEIIIDTLNGYHYLDRASIRVISRNKFEGNAWYKQIIGLDTFDIRFDSFELVEVPVGEPDRKGVVPTQLMTVSGGEVEADQNLIISPGFLYKGSVSMYAYKEALELDGFVKLNLDGHEEWVSFLRSDEDPQVKLPFDNAQFESGGPAYAGIHRNIRDELYTTFVEKRQTESDFDFFRASGILTYDDSTQTYKIENHLKSTGESYAGSTMIYVDSSKSVVFEGPVDFFKPSTTEMQIKASVLGVGNAETEEYQADVMMMLDFKVAPTILDIMALDLTDIIERIGPAPANDISIELLYKLANLVGESTTRFYEENSLRNYTSLVSTSRELEKPIMISGMKMQWSKEHKAWHNTTKIGLSNVVRDDLNAKLDGFIEIKKDETGEDALSLFIQAAPGVWYYIAYSKHQIIMFSSNPKFNEEVEAKSNIGKAKPGEVVFVGGETNETLSFINDFRLKYFGLTEPYNLISPDDISLEDESFDTIEKTDDDDDGFGFK